MMAAAATAGRHVPQATCCYHASLSKSTHPLTTGVLVLLRPLDAVAVRLAALVVRCVILALRHLDCP